MILVDGALARREAEGRPIRVGMIGAGFQGSGVARQILRSTPGMQLCAVANRTLAKASACFSQADVEPVAIEDAGALADAIRSDRAAITQDAQLVAESPDLDAIIEVTGSIEPAARAILAAIRSGKHVIQENTTVSSSVACTARRKSVCVPAGTSSPQHSITRVAPSSRK